MRQPDLTLCLEEVHKPHNVSAVIRSADAVGIHDLHAVWPEKIKTLVSSAAGSNSWVNVHNHDTLADAVTLLKSQGMQILATHLSDSAVDFRRSILPAQPALSWARRKPAYLRKPSGWQISIL